ncbi:winged helix-turn-helix domain-containing protein [Vibrio sp. RE88]|uniref:winged helix-turn-helix domain-containing protein n=1 Tax=Vibrio sp. RE88 TaxID=2607610 RepID=UPI001493B970|nr:winged helix-turn-helix domain-containing protein [Vibrio sp. RE88]NOH62813.1 hypothetical protein [Vibrio sp. RE88]
MSKNDSIVYYCDDLILDRKEMSIQIDSHENKLNYNELMIIIHFMENNNQVISKNHLISVGWPDSIVTDSSLHKAVFNLRSAISYSKSVEIKTIPNKGYMWVCHHFEAKRIEQKSENTAGVGQVPQKLLKVGMASLSVVLLSAALWSVSNSYFFNMTFIDDQYHIMKIQTKTVLKRKDQSLPQELIDKIKDMPCECSYFYYKNKDTYELSIFSSKNKTSNNYFIDKDEWGVFIKEWDNK